MPRPTALLLLTLAACFEAETAPAPSGAAPAPAPPKVDVLLVIDTSASMKEESSAVLLGVEGVIDALGSADWQIAVTTTSADYPHSGPTAEIDPGEAGTLVGNAITPGPGAADALRVVLACGTIFWKESNLLSDPSYAPAADGSCPLPVGTEVPEEYLDCLCPDGWNESEGAGKEEGLEVVAAAMCERGGDVPEDCFATESSIASDEAGVNADFWRADALPRAVILSDEGDGSRRESSGDGEATAYLDLYDQLSANFRLYVLGPAYHDADGSCLDGAQTWGVERYRSAAEETGGAYAELRDLSSDCAANDVAAELAELLANAAEE